MVEINNSQNEFDCNSVKRLLLVCTGNTCRSPMAEALAGKYLPEIQTTSAGVSTLDGLGASVGAMEAMEEMGLSLDCHYSRQINGAMVQEADLILTMTSSHTKTLLGAYPESVGKTFTLGEFAGTKENVADPFGLGREEYLACAQALAGLLKIVGKRLGQQEK